MTIANSQFSTLTVAAGQTVKVVNNDPMEHTVTGAGGIEVTVPANGTGSFTAPEQPGVYLLICHFHPDMHGRLTVT